MSASANLRVACVRVEPCLEIGARCCAAPASDLAAVSKQDEGRDAADVVALGCRWVGVDIDLHDEKPPRVLPSDLIEDRGGDAARTAPARPEVDEHRDGCVCDDALETVCAHHLRRARAVELTLAASAHGLALPRARDAIQSAAAHAPIDGGHPLASFFVASGR